MSNCTACFELHEEYQSIFPLKPMFQPELMPAAEECTKPVVTVDRDAFQKLGIRKFTTNVVVELDQLYSTEASTSFNNALVANKSIGLEKRKTSNKRRGLLKNNKAMLR